MRARAVALTLLIASSTAAADPAPILGGTKATVGQFPTVVAIFLGGGLCTGTLITPDWVVTAGHCVSPRMLGLSSQDQVTANTTVFFDTTIAGQGGKSVKAKATFMNPQYDDNPQVPGLVNDVGLIHLASSITDRTPVPLNRTAASAPMAGLHLTMVGYGVSQSGTNNAGVEYVLADKVNESCTNVGDPGALDANLLCWAQSDLTGKCEGDSGGPSFTTINGKKFQVGITSVGWSTGSQTACNEYGADTRTDHVIAWLDSVVGDSLKCASDGVCMSGCTNDPDCPTCAKDTDCTGTDQVCDMGKCVPAPFTTGGVGSTCTKDTDCASGVCGTVGTDKKCTESCQTDNNACPSGFDCLPTSTSGTAGACWPGANGGGESSCSASGGGSGATLFLIGFAALFIVRRRSTRRR